MGTTVRNTNLSIIDSLLISPKQFSFEMASYILGYGANRPFGKEIDVAAAPFRTHSLNVFHLRGTEIEKIEDKNGVKVVYVERLSISGLNAPLPTPYTELIFTRNLAQDRAMGAFVNTFNTRLLGISYQISQRRFINLQCHKHNCPMVRTIAALCGENPDNMDRRLSRLAFLFWTKEKSAVGLQTLVSTILNVQTKVTEYRPRWIKRAQLLKLGEMHLGKNSELGAKISTYAFGVDVHITHRDYDKILRLITDVNILNELRRLMKKYLSTFIDSSIFITPQTVPALKLNRCLLGRTSWIPGKKMDSLKLV